MNYVESFNMLGVEAKQIPSITGSGAPTPETEGAVGCLYMDTNNGKLYKCTSATDGVYVWEAPRDPANALKGSVVGGAVSMPDVSPIDHELRVKVTGDDVEGSTVSQYGKNILPFPYYNKGGTFNNYTYTVNADGSITASGTPTGQYNFMFAQGYTVYKGVKYTLSVDKNLTASGGWLYIYSNSLSKVVAQVGLAYESKAIFTPTTTITDANIYFVCQPSDYFLGTVKVQLEIGNSVTPYEKPTNCIATATVNADGTVDGLVSHYPSTTLLTDTDGAIIECEYNKDLNKAYDALVQAIISLGGNV